MELGMIGLGRMGGGMTARLRRFGHEVVGYDRNPEISDVDSVTELVRTLAAPRTVWVMLPAGGPTTGTVDELAGLLQQGDLVINGANDHYRTDRLLAERLGRERIDYLDVGVSGGVWGLEEGFALMVGGPKHQVDRVQPILDALAPQGGFVHASEHVGAGHYTKMVHNGVEYALMQAYGEGYELLKASELDIDVDGAFAAWRNGSVIRSWLLDLAVLALEADPGLSTVRGYADDTGEGRWTVEESIRLAVPAPCITSSLYARFSSRIPDSPTMKLVAALRGQFGGHAVRKVDE